MMMEIKKCTREVFLNDEITTWCTRGAPPLEAFVEVGTNGHQGGDTGHGSRTYIRAVLPVSCSDIHCKLFNGGSGEQVIEVTAGGDWELDCIRNTFRFIADTLDKCCENQWRKP